MKKYCQEIIENAQKICLQEDYLIKKRCKEHNKAIERLLEISKELINLDCKEMLLELLNSTDERVKLAAGSICLKLKINVKEAIKTLQLVQEKSKDGTLSFTAEMTVREYKRETL